MAGACDGEKETGDGHVLVVQKTSLSSAALESHKLAEASLKDSARSSIVDIDRSVLRGLAYRGGEAQFRKCVLACPAR
jgi:hypothetical protein